MLQFSSVCVAKMLSHAHFTPFRVTMLKNCKFRYFFVQSYFPHTINRYFLSLKDHHRLLVALYLGFIYVSITDLANLVSTGPCNILLILFRSLKSYCFYVNLSQRVAPAHFMVRHKLSITHKVESPTWIQPSMYPKAVVT